MSNLNKYLSRQDAATFLGISPRTLSRWHSERVGPPLIKVRRCVRYSEASLIDWLDDQERKPCRS